MLFGSNRDFGLLTGIARELLKDVIEQEVGYYKLSLEDTFANIYGEAPEKGFLDPVLLNCLITRGDQVISVDELGPDLNREVSFAFLRKDLETSNTLPEVGDILYWNGDHYEVDTVRENQLFIGRDSGYNLTSYGDQFGSSVSVICDTHLTRVENLGLQPLNI